MVQVGPALPASHASPAHGAPLSHPGPGQLAPLVLHEGLPSQEGTQEPSSQTFPPPQVVPGGALLTMSTQ